MISPRFSTARAVVECTHIGALALWLAATLGSALAAAVVFPTMKALQPRLPDYAAYAGDHALIAGGSVAQRVFLIADIIQFPASLIAVITLAIPVVFMGASLKRPAGVARTLAMGIAVAAFASLLFIVTPQLNAATTAHWAAMKLNDAPEIARHKAAVDEIHPIASRLMGAMGLSVLTALIAACWSLTRPSIAPAPPASRYEEPALARSGSGVRP